MKRKLNRSAMLGRAFLTVCALILSACLAFAGSNRISKDLERKNAPDQVGVMLGFHQVPVAECHGKVLSRGGTLKQDLGFFKGGAYTVPTCKSHDLAAVPDVVSISPDRRLHGAYIGSASAILDCHTDTVNSPVAWAQGAMSPTAALDTDGNVILLNSSSVPVSDLILWGTAAVCGNSIHRGTVGGLSILWGTLAMQGESILWGTLSVVDENALWGKSASGAFSEQE
jgi:hypothetical protein